MPYTRLLLSIRDVDEDCSNYGPSWSKHSRRLLQAKARGAA
jgi:hypothetical protein